VSEPNRAPRRPAPASSDQDRAVLNATLDQLATAGVAGTRIATVAAATGVPDADLQRRWGSAAALIVEAVASLDSGHRPAPTTSYDELVAELLAFRRVMAHPGARVAANAALDEATWPELARLYRDRIMRTQRSRLRRILDQARRQELLDADDADIVTAVSWCTGSWYGLVLAGVRPARDWGSTVARLTWRSLGGRPPT
jgi:AcrR family transcriptional regulator